MTAANYDRCMRYVLKFEGGKVDDPQDPGGRTNQGVIQRVYDGWRERNGLPRQDVYDMLDDERDEIYREGYWNQVRGDQLPPGIDVVVFDGAVNSGPHQSIKWLQRALGVTRIDGVVGPATLASIDAHKNHDQLVADICERRMDFLKQLKTFKRFGKGWTARVQQVRAIGHAWASGATYDRPLSLLGDMGEKAPIEDAKSLPGKGPADAATGAGIGGGAVSGVLGDTKDALTPLGGMGGWIDNIIIALIIASALCIIGGLGYRWYAGRRAHERADALDLPSGVTA